MCMIGAVDPRRREVVVEEVRPWIGKWAYLLMGIGWWSGRWGNFEWGRKRVTRRDIVGSIRGLLNLSRNSEPYQRWLRYHRHLSQREKFPYTGK